jgi:hypothetical protein
MFEISSTAAGHLVVRNLESTNGLVATHYNADTDIRSVLAASTNNWNLTGDQELQLLNALTRFFWVRLTLGDTARSLGYPALVD